MSEWGDIGKCITPGRMAGQARNGIPRISSVDHGSHLQLRVRPEFVGRGVGGVGPSSYLTASTPVRYDTASECTHDSIRMLVCPELAFGFCVLELAFGSCVPGVSVRFRPCLGRACLLKQENLRK
eukprot:3622380-Prymnesium_polylepis.2